MNEGRRLAGFSERFTHFSMGMKRLLHNVSDPFALVVDSGVTH
jgi:hypothetical protein